MSDLITFYTFFIQDHSVYIYQLIPIFYFTWIFGKLMYYKLKYGVEISPTDVLTLVTLVALGFDYGYYLYQFMVGTGQLLSFTGFLIKYSVGTILWIWMIFYHYHAYIRRSLPRQRYVSTDRKKVFFAYAFTILVLFSIVVLYRVKLMN